MLKEHAIDHREDAAGSASDRSPADGHPEGLRERGNHRASPPEALLEPDQAWREPDQPPAPAEAQGGGESDASTSPGFARRHPVLIVAGVCIALGAGGAGYLYWDDAAHYQSTDDAFVEARQFAIAPKVSGNVVDVPVTDNQHLDAGQVVARIDDRDYRTALAQAEAQVASARSSMRNIDAQIVVQQATIRQSQAQVSQAKASLTFADEQADRYARLAQTGAGTVQNAQQYSSTRDQQRASLETAQASETASERQIQALAAQRDSAAANLAQANAQLDQARLNLSYTVLTAAQPGRVVNLSASLGQYAAAGTNLTMFVPDELWVTANFKETQLDAMRAGQPATIKIDAYPERALRGRVASVQPGSGTAFSLLPAENATGNYVKIVQRVPVKLRLDVVPGDLAMGPGMSVEPTVRVDPSPSLLERLRARL